MISAFSGRSLVLSLVNAQLLCKHGKGAHYAVLICAMQGASLDHKEAEANPEQ
jgi:hypothetical protein